MADNQTTTEETLSSKNDQLQQQFLLLTMSHIEYKIGKALEYIVYLTITDLKTDKL